MMEHLLNKIHHMEAMELLAQLPDDSIDCMVTSPPYYGLRSYVDNDSPLKKHEIGLEESPEEYIENLVSIFREARRVLKKEGVLFLNLGDSYWQNRAKHRGAGEGIGHSALKGRENHMRSGGKSHAIYKPKDLMMIPARVALALQADGWYLRSDIIWHKPNRMPESVKDRPTNDYEHVFLLSKSRKYYYNADKVREDASKNNHGSPNITPGKKQVAMGRNVNKTTLGLWDGSQLYRNKRAVWSISTKPFGEAHFAVMPLELADTCIKAGCPQGGIVLDMFGGAGTVAIAALNNECQYILSELNSDFCEMARVRISQHNPYQDKQYKNGEKQLSLFEGLEAK